MVHRFVSLRAYQQFSLWKNLTKYAVIPEAIIAIALRRPAVIAIRNPPP